MSNNTNSIENTSLFSIENKDNPTTTINNDEALTKLQESLLTITPSSTKPMATNTTTTDNNSTLANKSTESVELNITDKLAITATDDSDDIEQPKTMGNIKKSRKLLDSDDDSDVFNKLKTTQIIQNMSSSSDNIDNKKRPNKKIQISKRPLDNNNSSSSTDNEESADETKKSPKKIKKLHKKSSKIKKNKTNSSGSSSSSSGTSSDSSDEKVEENPLNNIIKPLKGICDSDSSIDEDYKPNIIENDKISTDVNKKSIKLIERPPKRMSAKEAEEQMKAIQSESQRLVRESNLCVPYHRPKQHSLKEFLNRRTINKPIPTMDMKKAAAAIKMTKEELIEYAKKLDERAKESQEFFKSESEAEEEVEDEGEKNIEINKKDITPENDKNEQLTKKSTVNIEIIQSTTITTQDIVQETESMDCELLKSTDTNMESFPIFSTEDMIQEANKLCEPNKSVENLSQKSTTTNTTNDSIILQKNPIENDSTTPINDANAITNTTSLTTITKTIEIDYNFDNEELNLNSTKAKQKLNNFKDSLLARMTTPANSTKFIDGPCRLKGTKDCMIDLDTGNILPALQKTGPEELFERFRKHSKKPTNKTTEQSISVISKSNGFFEMEKIKIKVDEDEPIIQDSKPRSAFFKLKQAFSSKLAERRKEEILRRKEETEAAKKKAKKLSKEDNEESDDDDEENDNDENENDDNETKETEEGEKNAEKELINKEIAIVLDTKIDDQNFIDKCDEINDENMFNSEDEEENNAKSVNEEESDEENILPETDGDNEKDDNDDDDEEDIENNDTDKPKSRKRIFQLDDSDNEITENNENINHTQKLTINDELSNDLDDDLLNIGGHKPLGGCLLATNINNSPKKLFTQNIDECVTESQLYDLCSGNFATQMPQSTQAATTPPAAVEEEQTIRLNLESSDDENEDDTNDKLFKTNKKSNKNNRKIIKKLSDDEDDDDNNRGGLINKEKLTENNSEDDETIGLSLQINESDDSDEEEDDNDEDKSPEEENDKCIEYDSEENEIEIIVTKTDRCKKAKQFLENEAELSDSDWDSADEDEKDLDKLEIELGDEDKFDQEQLHSELERIHMRRLLDKDAREVKILKEMLIDDEEDTGLGRERQFKWLNVDNNFDDLQSQTNNEDDGAGGGGGADAGSDNENELEWRKMRYERELLLNKSKIDNNDDSLIIQRRVDIDQELGGKIITDDTNGGGSTGGLDATKIPIVKKKILIIKSSNNTPQLSANNSPFLIDKEVTKKNTRNSFLGRGEETLARLATLTTKNSAETDGTLPSVAVAAKQRNFVFKSITPNAAAEKKNNKRKSSDTNANGGHGGDDDGQDLAQVQKKRKTTHENNNKIKKRLLDILT